MCVHKYMCCACLCVTVCAPWIEVGELRVIFHGQVSAWLRTHGEPGVEGMCRTVMYVASSSRDLGNMGRHGVAQVFTQPRMTYKLIADKLILGGGGRGALHASNFVQCCAACAQGCIEYALSIYHNRACACKLGGGCSRNSNWLHVARCDASYGRQRTSLYTSMHRKRVYTCRRAL